MQAAGAAQSASLAHSGSWQAPFEPQILPAGQ
jgi:hypothetical protein